MRNIAFLSAAFLGLVLTSCEKPASFKRGWEYNNEEFGGIEKRTEVAKSGQETAPGLIFIPGGTFEMGNRAQDVMYLWDNQSKTMEVDPFFMDECEVTISTIENTSIGCVPSTKKTILIWLKQQCPTKMYGERNWNTTKT